jgi:hypothetical protein
MTSASTAGQMLHAIRTPANVRAASTNKVGTIPADDPSQPAKGYVSSQQACESAYLNCTQ